MRKRDVKKLIRVLPCKSAYAFFAIKACHQKLQLFTKLTRSKKNLVRRKKCSLAKLNVEKEINIRYRVQIVWLD